VHTIQPRLLLLCVCLRLHPRYGNCDCLALPLVPNGVADVLYQEVGGIYLLSLVDHTVWEATVWDLTARDVAVADNYNVWSECSALCKQLVQLCYCCGTLLKHRLPGGISSLHSSLNFIGTVLSVCLPPNTLLAYSEASQP
jgi:hypothetical protein